MLPSAGVTTYCRYTEPENIYRYFPGTDNPVVKEHEDQFRPLEPEEHYLIPSVTGFIRKNLPGTCELVVHLAIGSHRDHVMTRIAAEQLGIPLWYYADYSCLIYGEHTLADWLSANPETFLLEISPEGLKD